MTQKKFRILFAAILGLSSVAALKSDVFAESTMSVDTSEKLIADVSAGNDVQLSSDINMTGRYFYVGSTAENAVVDVDLNGHTLTMNDAYFVVSNNSSLRIFNSQANQEASVVNATNAVVEVNQGTLTIDSGSFLNNTHVIKGNTGSTVTINGGTFQGNGLTAEDGGVIAMTSGTLNINGGHFNSNTGKEGGAVKANGSTVTMTAGTFTSNTADTLGGALNLYNSTFTMTGGTMEYNAANATGWATGGGAVWAGGSSTVNLLGGKFDSNYAYASGGAILFRGTKMVIGTVDGSSSPMILNNTSKQHEGGALALITGDTIMHAGTLTGNAAGYNQDGTANTDFYDWGGGAIFVSDQGNNADGTRGASLYIPTTAVIKDNEAGGFGGGIAGCSTGRVVLSADGTSGAAVFNNTADMQNVSGSTSAKNEDHTFGLENQEFMEDGADDYFCAFNSTITNKMLGGYANWTGSIDGEKYTASGDTVVTSSSVAGLKSNGSYTGKAMVTISGNKSYTHGGGILSNGYLVIGKASSIEVGKPVEVIASKTLLGTDGAAMSTMDGKTFTFTLKDSENNTVATGTADATGKITFNNRLTFNADNCKEDTNVFTYTLTEDTGKDANVSYDNASVTFTITVLRNQAQKVLEDGTTMDHTWYTIDTITAQKDGTDLTVSAERQTDEAHSCILNLGTSTFTNQELTQISVTKKFDDQDNKDGIRVTPTASDFELEQNGTALSNAKAEVLDNNDGTYTIQYSGLTPLDADGNAYQYAVKEINTHGYTVVYAETEQQAAYDQETIVNKHTPKTTTPKTPEEPTTPEKPTVPSVPTEPENPTVPTSPAVPVTPQTQETTVTPETPATPDTGDQTNTAGALHALVLSMMLAGCAVVLRRKYSD